MESRFPGSSNVRERVGNTRNSADSIKNREEKNTTRTRTQIAPRESNERNSVVRSTAYPDFTRTNNSGNSSRQRETQSASPSVRSGSSTGIMFRNNSSSARENVRINRSPGQSSLSRSSGSSSPERSYSTSPSVSRSRAPSASSSSRSSSGVSSSSSGNGSSGRNSARRRN